MEENPSQDYRVQFVTERAISRQGEPGTITIAPSSDSWNDFGERILVEIAIQPRSETPFSHERLTFRGFFGFVDKQAGKSDTLHLRDIANQTPDTPVPVDKVPGYFTMLPDMASYRRIVGDLGPEEARVLRVVAVD